MIVTSMRVAPIGVSASANGVLTLREESTSMQILPMRVLCMVLLIASGAATANPNVPPPPQAEPILVTNAVIHTVSGATIADGHMLFSEGRITAVGASEFVAPNTRVIDLGGRHVYPGLIAAHTALGLGACAVENRRGTTHHSWQLFIDYYGTMRHAIVNDSTKSPPMYHFECSIWFYGPSS